MSLLGNVRCRTHATVVAVLLAGIAVPGIARAATCTIFGTVSIEPLDGYYCDRDWLGSACNGWREVDLDQGARPMKHLLVTVNDPETGTQLASTATTSTGSYLVSVPNMPDCSRTVQVRFYFARVHEADIAPTRFRFWVVDPETGFVSYNPWNVPLTGILKLFSVTYHRANPDEPAVKLANMYYTTQSAITEIVRWTTNLNEQFARQEIPGILRIRYDPFSVNTSVSTDVVGWQILFGSGNYNQGGSIRHELGHLVHAALHHRRQINNCLSYAFNNGDPTVHGTPFCEYGQAAMIEGLANFIAARSITTSNSAWWSFCAQNENQDLQSETAFVAPFDPDRRLRCTTASVAPFAGIGDAFSTLNAHCVRLQADEPPPAPITGCNCGETDELGICTGNFYRSNGWRNEIQVARFLWDIIDSNNEGGQDNANYSMGGPGGLAAILEGMRCGPRGFGTDGNCNEPNDQFVCNASDGTIPPLPMRGSRDSYNVYDIAQLLPTNETAERRLNCVQGPGGSPNPMD